MSTTLSVYRNLVRAANITFQGDARLLTASRQRIRDGFRERRNLSADDPHARSAIQEATEIALMLRANVIQGKLVGDRYVLRIHEDTERGDNDTIKITNTFDRADVEDVAVAGSMAKMDGKTCR